MSGELSNQRAMQAREWARDEDRFTRQRINCGDHTEIVVTDNLTGEWQDFNGWDDDGPARWMRQQERVQNGNRN